LGQLPFLRGLGGLFSAKPSAAGKTPSRKGIVPYTLLLTCFPSYSFFFFSRKDPPRRAGRRGAKKLWSTSRILLLACLPSGALAGFASYSFFLFFTLAKTHRGVREGDFCANRVQMKNRINYSRFCDWKTQKKIKFSDYPQF
jgi:hypothetical protein